MKILSLRQPWASLVASGAKDVENRTWPIDFDHARSQLRHVTQLQSDAPACGWRIVRY
jgi:hypothetical protein